MTGPGAAPKTVLLVEDDDLVRSLVQRVLQASGYRVLAASQAEEALAVATRHAGPIDLLLTDVVLPDISGPEVAARLMPQRPEMRVLYTSGQPEETLECYGLSARAIGFLPKPFTPEALRRAVRRALSAPRGTAE